MTNKSYQQFNDLNQLKLELEFGGFACEFLYWGFFDGSQWWRNYLHVHSFFELCYVLEGEGSFTNNGLNYRLKAGDLFLAKPDEQHEIISSQEQPLALFFWSYTLLAVKPDSQLDVSKLFDAFSKTKQPLVSQQEQHLSLLEAIVRELNQKKIAYDLVIKDLAKQLLIETARAFTQLSHNAEQHPETKYQDAVVKTIIRYLNDNYYQPLKLEAIAAQVHLSERHMSRIFKTATGQSIKKYATQLRITNAKQLLLNANVSISDVAYQTGYQDVRHFSTVFRKATGSSPSAFRAKGGTQFL